MNTYLGFEVACSRFGGEVLVCCSRRDLPQPCNDEKKNKIGPEQSQPGFGACT